MLPQTRKLLALSLGLAGMLAAATAAEAQRGSQSDGQTLVIEEARIDWLLKSDVSALREGVIDKMELRIGKEVVGGGVIGLLHKEIAELSVAEARIQASSQGAILKAEAQKKLAGNVILRNRALLAKGPGYVSQEEVQKGEAEYAAADAAVIEANDTQALAQAKLASARRVAEEHIIRAPFPGIIIEEYKHVGESVRANEPVVKLGNLDRLRVWTYIPVEYAHRVSNDTVVDVQIKLGDGRSGKHPIEMKKFRGVVTLVAPSVQTIGENGVRVYAEIDNPTHELKPGYKATMTFNLKAEEGAQVAQPGVSPTNVGSRDGLPTLPR